MKRTLLSVIFALLSSGFASPQDSTTPTVDNTLSATLADLRGRAEMIEGPVARSPLERSALWFSSASGPIVSTVKVPAPRPAAGTVSARQLRHQVPKAAQESYDKALRLSRNNELEKAAGELERAVALDPDFVAAHDELGVAYARLNRNPDAAAEFRRTIELAPGESVAHSNLAWMLFAMGQRPEAEASARHALTLSAENARAHLLIGRMLVETPMTFAEGLKSLEYAARTIPEAKAMVKALKKR